jgi:hypothetical protein
MPINVKTWKGVKFVYFEVEKHLLNFSNGDLTGLFDVKLRKFFDQMSGELIDSGVNESAAGQLEPHLEKYLLEVLVLEVGLVSLDTSDNDNNSLGVRRAQLLKACL